MVVTHGFKDVLVEDGIRADKIFVITNGVYVTPNTERRTDTQDDKLILSYFGTLGISQNITDTFAYADALAGLCSNFTYLIIGEGAQRAQIEAFSDSGKVPYLQLKRGMTA